MNQERYLGSFDSALHKGGASAGSPGFDLELGLNQWTAFVRDDVDPANRVELSDDSAPLVNSWHHLAVTVDRSAGFIRAYRDGLLADSEALVNDSVSGTASLCLGRRGVPMIGRLDEVRIHAVARSAAWFETTYTNVALRSTFMMVGDER